MLWVLVGLALVGLVAWHLGNANDSDDTRDDGSPGGFVPQVSLEVDTESDSDADGPWAFAPPGADKFAGLPKATNYGSYDGRIRYMAIGSRRGKVHLVAVLAGTNAFPDYFCQHGANPEAEHDILPDAGPEDVDCKVCSRKLAALQDPGSTVAADVERHRRWVFGTLHAGSRRLTSGRMSKVHAVMVPEGDDTEDARPLCGDPNPLTDFTRLEFGQEDGTVTCARCRKEFGRLPKRFEDGTPYRGRPSF
ncbi:MAG: hypothetical protein ACQEXJ_23800 [Myxococcota bacterium]